MKQQVFRYVFSGIIAVIFDLCIYSFCILFVPYWVSKGIGFITGSSTAFLLNKYWTFQRKGGSLKEIARFAFLYCVSLCANIFCNALVLTLWDQQVFLGFLVATSMSTIINYIGQKFWVFAEKPEASGAQ
jgi:putative flippase GtrA